MNSSVFFFFQAEDGIRDRNVTGVQTCALPILLGADPRVRLTRRAVTALAKAREEYLDLVHPGGSVIVRRSEERRVGKEGRARGGAEHIKKRRETERDDGK